MIDESVLIILGVLVVGIIIGALVEIFWDKDK